jgi:hypothetical protein
MYRIIHSALHTALHSVCTTVTQTISDVWNYVCVEPLYVLFRAGPSIHGVGFWQGKSDSEVCAEMTNTRGQFWTENSSECQDLIHKRFRSFHISCVTFVVSYVVVGTVRAMWYRHMVMYPLLRELRLLRSTDNKKSDMLN